MLCVKQLKARRSAYAHVAKITSIAGLLAVVRPMATVTTVAFGVRKRWVMRSLKGVGRSTWRPSNPATLLGILLYYLLHELLSKLQLANFDLWIK
jgi:hypothetical protein